MNCSNCNAEITSGFLKSNQLLSEEAVNLINSELNLKAETFCNACGNELYKQAIHSRNQKVYDMGLEIGKLKSRLRHRIDILRTDLNKNIKNIPVLTTHTPYNWQYISLGLVSGQIVTGTGLVAEVFSDFTDFFGAKSNSFTGKLTKSEEFVLNQIRVKAVLLGGNAVIATDIDYGEVGAAKGMLMVCAAGTSITLNNTEILGEDKQKIVSNITSWQNEKKAIENTLLLKDKDFMQGYEKFISMYEDAK